VKRALALVVGCAALAALWTSSASRAAAADGGGIAGYVVDGATGRGVVNERVFYYRWPYVENSTIVAEQRTDGRGYFSDITLAPGRYVLAVAGVSQISGCTVEDVFGGEVSRVRIALGHTGASCSGPRPHPSLVDGNATADVYRI
jgi:hypothetical protein